MDDERPCMPSVQSESGAVRGTNLDAKQARNLGSV